jgi:20S proteasome alpha/beta subunit
LIINQDYILDEGKSLSYPFTHDAISMEHSIVEESVTIGVGVIAEAGEWIIIGSDMRASWPNVSPNDAAGKQWDFPTPFDCCMCVAGKLSVAQMLVSELSSRLERLTSEPEIFPEHVENAINDSRYRVFAQHVDWELRKSYCITLKQWLSGKIPGAKMSPLIRKAGEAIIDGTPLPVEILMAGFVHGKLLFYKASDKRHLEMNISPPTFAIGSGAVLAMEHLNKRGHHPDCSLARSILHVAEALEAAEKEPHNTVGKALKVTVIHGQDGMGQFPLDGHLIEGWKKAYADRPGTDSLQYSETARAQVLQGLLRHVRREEEGKPRPPAKRH